ncbi:MAG TPA: peptide ABC transporter substrate-binding protein [Acidobacteriota bacterium]|jgi:hypothetical protein|nr:peptide ABC transporter substrate-binding protein [Acidobacteriota bacterium]
MDRGILESDWKLLRELRPLALGRFCDRVLVEVSRLAADASKSSHERYLALFELLYRRDKELGDAFNNPRRSTAVVQLAHIRFQELLTDEEFARFSPETRASIQVLLDMWRA